MCDCFSTHPEDKILILDVSDADFVTNENHFLQIKELVESDFTVGTNHFKIKG